jgi:hypothetical protein
MNAHVRRSIRRPCVDQISSADYELASVVVECVLDKVIFPSFKVQELGVL